MIVHLGNHQKVVKECEGCLRITVRIWDGVKICSCRPYPHMEWLLGKCKSSMFKDDIDKNFVVD